MVNITDNNENDKDILGRKSIVDAVFKTINESSLVGSNVISVCGKWGDGKSFIKDALLSRLDKEKAKEKDQDKRIVFFDFNPWQWVEENKLHQTFMEQLRLELKEYNYKDADKFEDFYKTSKEYKNIFLILSCTLAVISQLLFYFNVGIPLGLHLFLLASPMIVLVMGLMESAHKLTWLSYSIGSERSLRIKKQKLIDDIQENERKVVVLIDDIDRLSKVEIRELFKVIKLNADFKHFSFVLFYQKENVVEAFDDAYLKGELFLHKIVTHEYVLPPISKKKIYSLFIEKLDETGVSIKRDWLRAEHVELQLCKDIILNYLTNLRDLERFLESFKASLPLFLNDEVVELHLPDLILIELLRIFDYPIYMCVKENKNIFIQSYSYGLKDKENEAKLRSEIINFLRSFKIDEKSRRENILRSLFPVIEFAIRGHSLHSVLDIGGIHKERKIKNSLYFDRYFLNEYDGNVVSLKKINNALKDIESENEDGIDKLVSESYINGDLDYILNEVTLRLDQFKTSKAKLVFISKRLTCFCSKLQVDTLTKDDFSVLTSPAATLITTSFNLIKNDNDDFVSIILKDLEPSYPLLDLLSKIEIGGVESIHSHILNLMNQLFLEDEDFLKEHFQSCPYSLYELNNMFRNQLAKEEYDQFRKDLIAILLSKPILAWMLMATCPKLLTPEGESVNFDLRYIKHFFEDRFEEVKNTYNNLDEASKDHYQIIFDQLSQETE